MPDKSILAVLGADGPEDIPGLAAMGEQLEMRFAHDTASLRQALAGADIMLGWTFEATPLREAWDAADRLRWIHWFGAGVDSVLFPALAESEVVLTNARGVFDRAMAEYVLGLVIAFPKRFKETVGLQLGRRWRHRLTSNIEGRRALVVGSGSIGRTIARLLKAAGLEVAGVGRSARPDPDFGHIHAIDDLDALLPDADYVIGVAPLTERTRHLFGAAQFRAMRDSAIFINVGRGPSVDEAALVEALRSGAIAGAGLDVFETEPLPADSPLWEMDNVLVSPHMSGDFEGYAQAIAALFLSNFARYRNGEPLRNIIDKTNGFAAS